MGLVAHGCDESDESLLDAVVFGVFFCDSLVSGSSLRQNLRIFLDLVERK